MQVGREAMEERLALIVSSVEELREGLNDFRQGKTNKNKLFFGSSKESNKNIIEPLLKGRAGKEFIKVIIEDQQLVELGRLWVAGGDIEWELLYPVYKPNRIHLPTYPFEKNNYWYKDFKDFEDTVLVSSGEVTYNGCTEGENSHDSLELDDVAIKDYEKVKEDNYSTLSNIEKQLVQIWKSVLNMKEININQTIFELGGDSISIIKLIEGVERKFPGKINIADFFSHSTIKQCAQHIYNGNTIINVEHIEEKIIHHHPVSEEDDRIKIAIEKGECKIVQQND
ncbi:hypothetical protein CN558_24075 [Bacillus wiedmannii]|uniref:acyl carrier protein n=1 Tax=Bacillus wiedmannii TaxID=1890302 RepID=UPI000BEF48D8|nr:hypothetical protein CN558_24075 [Bacillus wiedmannii]